MAFGTISIEAMCYNSYTFISEASALKVPPLDA